MLKKLLQMDQLEKFYSLIANDRVKIRLMSRSDNYMSFEVKESHGSAVKSFSIGYYNNKDSLSTVENYRDMIALGSYGWVKGEDGSYRKQSTDLCSFKQGSEGYKLLTNLFNDIKKLDFSIYDGKEFCNRTFSSFVEALRNLDSQRTTGTIDNVATGQSNSEKSITQEVGHEMQEDSEYVAAALKQQKFDFVSTNATENTSDVMKEIKRSNTSNGITTESIRDVVFRSSNFTSRNVSAFSEFNSTDATLPILPNESGITGTTVAGLSTLSIGVILGLLGAAVGLRCCLWNRRNKKSISDIEKGNGVEDSLPEVSTLLNKVEIEPGAYKSFRSNIPQ